MLFSAGAVRGAQDLLTKQAIWLVLATIAALVAAWIDLEWLKRRTPLIFGLCLFALLLTLLPGIGVKVNGAQRWIGLQSP